MTLKGKEPETRFHPIVVHARVLGEIAAQVPEWGARLEGIVDSGLPGPKGNREFFVHLTATR